MPFRQWKNYRITWLGFEIALRNAESTLVTRLPVPVQTGTLSTRHLHTASVLRVHFNNEHFSAVSFTGLGKEGAKLIFRQVFLSLKTQF